MDELTLFADLKPVTTALTGTDRAALRRELFGDAGTVRSSGPATLVRLDERGDRPGRRRAVLAVAAAVAVAGGLGVVLVSGDAGDVVPAASTADVTPTTTAPSPQVVAPASVPVPPRVLVDAPGWSMHAVWEVLAEPRADRGVVLAPTGTFPGGQWVRVAARASRPPAPLGTTPASPGTSTVDVDGLAVTVSYMDRLSTASWSAADGVSFSLEGWDVTTEEIRSLAAGLAADGVAVVAATVPDGWEVVGPEQVAALDHDTEVHFTDGTPSVPVSGDAPLPGGQVLTTRFYYGGERALRSRVAPGGSEVMTVGGEQLHIESDASYVRIHVIRGGWTWEVDVQDAAGVTIDEALALFAQLREVDQATWTAALPAGTVTPATRAAVVGELLVGLPVPAGYDAGPVAGSRATVARASVAADVAVSVACAWLDEWAAGNQNGDVARSETAADALAGVSAWSIFDEAQPGDGWDDGVLQMAAMVTDDDSSMATALDEQLIACGLL